MQVQLVIITNADISPAIGCLHDEANTKQPCSKCIEHTLARRVL